MSLWISFLAKCKTFNVVSGDRGKYLSLTVNPILAEQIYMLSKLCVRYQIVQFILFTVLNLLSYIYENFSTKLAIFLGDTEENKRGFNETPCI